MADEFTQEQRDALDDMVARRMEATGETREEASAQIAAYLALRASPEWPDLETMLERGGYR